jgi:hypothetical protein
MGHGVELRIRPEILADLSPEQRAEVELFLQEIAEVLGPEVRRHQTDFVLYGVSPRPELTEELRTWRKG